MDKILNLIDLRINLYDFTKNIKCHFLMFYSLTTKQDSLKKEGSIIYRIKNTTTMEAIVLWK